MFLHPRFKPLPKLIVEFPVEIIVKKITGNKKDIAAPEETAIKAIMPPKNPPHRKPTPRFIGRVGINKTIIKT